MLATWDNIVGPKIEQVNNKKLAPQCACPRLVLSSAAAEWAPVNNVQRWSRSSTALDDDLLLHVARHTLNGEMMRPFTDEIEPKFYVLGDQGTRAALYLNHVLRISALTA